MESASFVAPVQPPLGKTQRSDNQKIQAVGFEIKMDVSKNRGTPKWMVYNGKPY